MNSIRLAAMNHETPEKFLNALAENYLLQDAILNATDMAVISFQYDGTITSVNKAGEPMLGYNTLDLTGKQKITLFHEHHEIEKARVELVKEGFVANTSVEVLIAKAVRKIADSREWTYKRKDGSLFPAKVSISGIWNEENELMGFLAIAENITVQKEAETARAASERKFKLLADNIQCTVYLCRNDEHYSTLYLNSQVTELTGYPLEEFLSGRLKLSKLYHPDDRQMIYERVNLATSLRTNFKLQYRILHLSGEWRWIDDVGIGIYEGDELVMLEGFMTDITDRINNEKELVTSKRNLEIVTDELRNQNHQLNEFAHIISHNLRSPVGNIGALISLLNEKSSISDYQTIFEKLKDAAGNLQETLNDLMETLMIKDEHQAQRVELDFEEVFSKIRTSFAGDIMKYQATVTYDFASCPSIFYSKTYLESIFLNLLSNAIKYRSLKRPLTVHFETFMEDGKEVLRVTDNALGIDMKKHGNQLFSLRKTFHEHKDARGVGLFLTKTQVEAMGGKISAESSPDQGTVFTVRFTA